MLDKGELKRAGLKVTMPRMKILEVLNSHQHLSAEDIYHHLKEAELDVGLATVYRVLSQFEAAGLIKRHRFEDNYSVYELDDGEHHDHLVCVCCGKVEEFVDEMIEKRQQEIAASRGYQLADHSLYLYGECSQCQKKK